MASPVLAKSKVTPKKVHISHQPITASNWHEHIDWMNTTFVAIIPLIGFIYAFSTPLVWKTAVWTFVYYFLTGLGITAGTHTCSCIYDLDTDENRLPQTMVTYFICSQTPHSNHARRARWRSNSRLNPLVVPKPSCSSSIHRHNEGSLYSSERHVARSYRLDSIQARQK
jgi:hypothetical protein